MDIHEIPTDKLEEFTKAQKEFASLLGSRGGKKTSLSHTKEWYQDNQRKAVEARKANQKLLGSEAKLVK